MSPVINDLVSEFVARLVSAVEVAMYGRLRAAVDAALPDHAGRDVSRWTPFREAKPELAASLAVTKTGRPRQTCPVPGCNGVAAPIYGMVCTQHKHVAKSKIAKYRKERKAKLEVKLRMSSLYGRTGASPESVPAKAPRKQRVPVYCPVPGCKGIAAPVFNMVCRDHKDVAPSKIAKYRRDRKAAKVGKSVPKRLMKPHPAAKKLAKAARQLFGAGLDKSVDKSVDKKVDKKTAKKVATKLFSTAKKTLPMKLGEVGMIEVTASPNPKKTG